MRLFTFLNERINRSHNLPGYTEDRKLPLQWTVQIAKKLLVLIARLKSSGRSFHPGSEWSGLLAAPVNGESWQ